MITRCSIIGVGIRVSEHAVRLCAAQFGRLDQAFREYPVIRCDSLQRAVDCYRDPEYQAAMTLAQRAYDRELVILQG